MPDKQFLLSVQDRGILVNTVLPKQADFIEMKLARKLADELTPTMEEFKAVGGRREGDMVTWDVNKARADIKAFVLGELAQALIERQLKTMSSAKQLTTEHVGLYEMFVEAKG